MHRPIRFIAIAVLVFAALPTFATAGEKFKDVFVVNTSDDPLPVEGVGTQQVAGRVEVSNLPAVQRLTHGSDFVSRDPRHFVEFPKNVVLTDVVITVLSGEVPVCEVALYEQRGTDIQGFQFLYPTQEERTEELHFVSGLTLPSDADAWGVAVNNECVLKVLWSGFTQP